jgi:hypothetical protein
MSILLAPAAPLLYLPEQRGKMLGSRQRICSPNKHAAGMHPYLGEEGSILVLMGESTLLMGQGMAGGDGLGAAF